MIRPVQHGNLLRDREYDFHVVFGEEQRQPSFVGNALQKPDRFAVLGCRHAGSRLRADPPSVVR